MANSQFSPESITKACDRFQEDLKHRHSVNIENRKFVFDIYKAAIDEYRFQVNLNWDRNKFFLVSSMTVIGAASAMMRFVTHPIPSMLIPILFLLSAFLGQLGLSGQKVGKKNYRATLDHLYEVLEMLNETNVKVCINAPFRVPAFRTTRGMITRAEGNESIKDGEITPNSFSSHLKAFFVLIILTGSIGSISSIAYFMNQYGIAQVFYDALSNTLRELPSSLCTLKELVTENLNNFQESFNRFRIENEL